ncbi:MAG: hypothetical protein U5L45_15905 [Saprospiraceae bacterium]|nr:hypothetical protein [Saprospiraceae bacterium]
MVKRLAPEKQFRLAPTTAVHVHASTGDGSYTDVLFSDLIAPLEAKLSNSIADQTYDSQQLTSAQITANSAVFTLTPLIAGTTPVRRVSDANGQFGIAVASSFTVETNGDVTVTVTGFGEEMNAGDTLGLFCTWKNAVATTPPVGTPTGTIPN